MAKAAEFYLALDIATQTGWCIGAPGKKPEFGSIRFGKPGSSRPAVYREFREWVAREWLSNPRIKIITFESSAVPMILGGGKMKTSTEAVKRLVGLCEHLEELCYGTHIELREAMVSQVRSHFLGNNRRKRDDAKAATLRMCRELGWDVQNDDEADACALWAYQVDCLHPEVSVARTPLFRSA
jgi:hypothetical protein